MTGASLHHFFAMGGYAAYLWPAYGIFFIVLVADFIAPVMRRRRLLRDVRSRLARNATRAQRPAPPLPPDAV